MKVSRVLLPFALVLYFSSCKGVNRLIGIDEPEKVTNQSESVEASAARHPHGKQTLVLYDNRKGIAEGYRFRTFGEGIVVRIDTIKEVRSRHGKSRRHLAYRNPAGYGGGCELVGPGMNVRNFENGYIRFNIRLTRPLNDSEQLIAGYEHYDLGKVPEGFSPRSTDWQSVYVKVREHGADDTWLESVTIPFLVMRVNYEKSITPVGWDIDQIYYVKESPRLPDPKPASSPQPKSPNS